MISRDDFVKELEEPGAVTHSDCSLVDSHGIGFVKVACYHDWSRVFVRCLIMLVRETELMNVFIQ
jgi:hypothetical protein